MKEYLLEKRREIEWRVNEFLETFEGGIYKVDAFTQITAGRGFKKDQLNIAVYLVGQWGVNVAVDVNTLIVMASKTQGRYNKEDTKSMLGTAHWLFIWHIEPLIKKIISER